MGQVVFAGHDRWADVVMRGMLIAGVALAIGLVILGFAFEFPGGSVRPASAGAGAGAAGAGLRVLHYAHMVFIPVLLAMTLAVIYVWTSPRRRTLAGFEMICAGAEIPFLLSDDNCQVLRANAAAHNGAGRPLATVADLIGNWSPESDEIIYRLTRHRGTGWSDREIIGPGNARTIAVRRVAGGLLMWRVEPRGIVAPPPLEGLSRPAARLSMGGKVIAANALFAALPDVVQTTVARSATQAADAARQETTAETADHEAMALTVIRTANGSGSSELIVLEAATRPGAAPEDVQADRSAGDTALGAGDDDALLNVLLEDLPVALVRMDTRGTMIAANAAARALLGDRAAAGTAFGSLVEGFGRPVEAQIRDAALGQCTTRTEQARGRIGERDVFLQVAVTPSPAGGGHELIALLNDATALRTLEQQFVQSQKMQAVGQMAGGVAHDFNNLLTAIIGHCDLLMLRTGETEPAFADLTQIGQNANRAAALVRQLLAFSRKQTLRPEPANLPDILNELSHLLNRLLGERVSIDLDHSADIWPVWIDARQFEQVIVNLAVNARDAMPDGGVVAVQTMNHRIAEETARDRAVMPAGDYVCIRVADTGTGMPPETTAKMFEPFFTTKRQGEGTGLGLSTAYGIVKQMDGFIFAESTMGQGTVFQIFLPRMIDAPVPAAATADRVVAPRDLTGTGCVLLVEDEEPVRAFAARALTLRGYDVIEADSAEAALDRLGDPDVRIDLLISDVVMPGLDGPTWVRQARMARPDVGVIFISGYAENVFRNGMDGVGNYSFLAKPFTLDELAAAVKDTLMPANR